MPELLFTSVGGSGAPVVSAVQHLQPDRVIFIVSEQSRLTVKDSVIPDLEADGFAVPAGFFDFIEIPDAQDLVGIIRTLRPEISREINSWRKRGDGYSVIVDITGGTKQMSAGLALISQRLPVEFYYTGGTERLNEGLGVVRDGTEHPVRTMNPWDVLGYGVIEDSIILFNHGHYSAAAEMLVSGRSRVKESDLRKRLSTFWIIADGYSKWELFRHEKALNQLMQVHERITDLRVALGDHQARELDGKISGNIDFIQKVIDEANKLKERQKKSKEGAQEVDRTMTLQWLIRDLFSNALRRQAEGRYDDAVARIYRAIEALAQDRLFSHGFDTDCVPADKLPGSLSYRWNCHDTGRKLKIGLQQDYELLNELGDPLGERFIELGLGDKESVLSQRNMSILAHGFEPVSNKSCDKLVDIFFRLSGISRDELVSFPEI